MLSTRRFFVVVVVRVKSWRRQALFEGRHSLHPTPTPRGGGGLPGSRHPLTTAWRIERHRHPPYPRVGDQTACIMHHMRYPQTLQGEGLQEGRISWGKFHRQEKWQNPPPGEMFAAWDPVFFSVRIPPLGGGGYLRILGKERIATIQRPPENNSTHPEPTSKQQQPSRATSK